MEEALAPFSSWANAKTNYGATGNGSTDDTAALQNALNALSTGRAQVLYLPPGTYRISATLNLTGSPSSGSGYFGWGGVGIIGADPSTTIIKWAGPSGQPMLIQNGGVGTRYSRITWDGSGTAGYGVAQWWNDNSGVLYGGSTEHQDEVFQDMTIGIMAGRLGANYGNLDSEGQVRRVTFIRNTYAGLNVGSWNALDWWVWDSQFIDCGRGVSNTYSLDDSGVTAGAGAVYVYRSLFEGSTVADLAVGNTSWFSLHNNVSIGSALFILALNEGESTGTVIAQNNRVVNATSSSPISYGYAGPLLLVDNQIQATGSTYSLNGSSSDNDVLALGNILRAGFPTATGTQRLLNVNNTTSSAASISTAPLALQKTPAVVTHTVYEVPTDSTAAQIQALINTALSSSDPQPIVHFGLGTWYINTTLTIPANGKVQLVGDGYQSIIGWSGTGAGNMLSIAAPAKVTVRDMQWLASSPTATAISITGGDSAGGRIQLVGVTSGPLSASNLQRTQLSLQANPQFDAITLTNVVNALAMSNGGIGAVTLASNSSFLMSDTWYEGDGVSTPLFTIPNGTFTYLGGHMASGSHGGTQSVPPVLVNGSTATQSYIAMNFDLTNVAGGIGAEIENEVSGGAYILGTGSNPGENNWFSRPGSGGEVGFNLNRQGSGSGQYTNQADTSTTAIVNTWAQARSLNWDATPYIPAAGATDIKIYHMKIDQTSGIAINGQ
jgi:hypothetical protein